MCAYPARQLRRGHGITWFAEEVFGHLQRSDQRRWAGVYLEGLLVATGRKSPQNLANALQESSTVGQSLHQFINASPWPWGPARSALTRMTEDRLPVRAWTATMATIPKRGDRSVGVHRRFVPEFGRTVNCQDAVGMFLASDAASVPVDWELVVDEDWCGDPVRRRRARLPESMTARPVWAHVLDMTGDLGSRISPAPVVVDARCATDATRLCAGLEGQGREFVIQVRPRQTVAFRLSEGRQAAPIPAYRAFGARPPAEEGGGRVRRGLAELVRRPRPSHDGGLVVCPLPVSLPESHGTAAEGGYRLWAERPHERTAAPRYWLTNMRQAAAEEIQSLVQRAHATRADLDHLVSDYGLFDFEGRSYPGWHHHMTMVSAAYAYRHVHLNPQETEAFAGLPELRELALG